MHHLEKQKSYPAVWACILIGGKSSRMGQPKHLLQTDDGRSWLERTVAIVSSAVDGVALSGAGHVPETLAHLNRLTDLPGIEGPLTGILSAMEWKPDVFWLLIACDMPFISSEAIAWLLEQRKEQRWGVVPKQKNGRLEPLFAGYEPPCRDIFKEMAASGIRRISEVAGYQGVDTVVIPDGLKKSWQNINRPEELP